MHEMSTVFHSAWFYATGDGICSYCVITLWPAVVNLPALAADDRPSRVENASNGFSASGATEDILKPLDLFLSRSLTLN
jgi:hypothetical protein